MLRLHQVLKSSRAAIDLASIMVGIIVIGLIGGVIAATIFAVIPWAQDNAAKQQLDSVNSAENAYRGLSSDADTALKNAVSTPSDSSDPNQVVVRSSFTGSTGLAVNNLLANSESNSYCVTGTKNSYAAYAKSGSGKVFTVSSMSSKPVEYNGDFPCANGTYNDGTSSNKNPTISSFVINCPSSVTSFYLPILTNVNATVSWSDGYTRKYTNATQTDVRNLTPGTDYTVTVDGSFERLSTGSYAGNSGMSSCIRAMNTWGSASGTVNADGAFSGPNVVSVPKSLPTTVTNLNSMFARATSFNDANVSSWNVSNVTNMTSMFAYASQFNQDLSSWNVSNVTLMTSMFSNAVQFNQNLGSWNVSQVRAMNSMFLEDANFKQDLSGWNVSKVTNRSLFNTGSGMTANQLPKFV
jgi:surface protein